jgi:hypothetical protein
MAFFLRIALLCSVLAEFQIARRSIVREHRTYSAAAAVGALGTIDLMGGSVASPDEFPSAMDIRNAKPFRLQKEM